MREIIDPFAVISFLLIFALLCSMAFMLKAITINKWVKVNSVFLIALSLVLIYKWGELTKESYACSVGFILFSTNLYVLLAGFINSKRKPVSVVLDFIWCGMTLFLSSCILAYVDDIPIRSVILKRFTNGYSTFIPGYFNEMWSFSAIFSSILVCYKYACVYLLGKLDDIQRMKINKIELQKRSIEAQFDALQTKVNPHFLYNALNSIAGLATIDGAKTREMALALSNLFRYSMNREQEVMRGRFLRLLQMFCFRSRLHEPTHDHYSDLSIERYFF